MMRMGRVIAGLLLLASIFLAGCSYMTRETIPPRVQLVGLQLQAAQLLEQRYLMTIRLQNPNEFELEINGFDFNVELNGAPFAQGVSNKEVTVPGFGDATTEVLVSSSLLTLMQQMNGGQSAVKYRLFGRVKLKGVPIPVSFETKGELGNFAKGS